MIGGHQRGDGQAIFLDLHLKNMSAMFVKISCFERPTSRCLLKGKRTMTVSASPR